MEDEEEAWIEESEDGYDVIAKDVENEDGLVAQRDTYKEAKARLYEYLH